MTQVKDAKGNLLNIGHIYEFSDAGETDGWRTHKLHSVDTLKTHQYRVGNLGFTGYFRIREVQATLGKIEQAPIELIDGEVYSFAVKTWNNRARLVGYYNKRMDAFYVNTHPSSSHIKDTSEVTDIVLLKPSV